MAAKPSKKTAPKQEPQSPRAQAKKQNNFLPWLVLAVLLALTYWTYAPALDNDFVDWDDYTYVINNELIRNNAVPSSEIWKRPVSLNYHPLTILSMRWQNNECPTCFEGISARPFIRANILIHLLNTLLLFVWLRLLLGGKSLWRALWISAVFALHPMHVESVAWVSERKDVLYVFFFFLSLLIYEKYQQNRSLLWLVLLTVSFLLACLSKAMAVVLPPVLLLLAFWKHKEEKEGSFWRGPVFKEALRLGPLFLIALFFGLMAVKVQAGGNFLAMLEVSGETPVAINDFDTFSLWQRLVFASYGFSLYIYKFFLPFGLSTYYPYPSLQEYEQGLVFKLIVLAPLALGLFSFLLLRKAKIVFVGLGFYFLTVALVLQFVSVGAVIAADRYTYLPYVGLALLLAQGSYLHLPKAWHKGIYALGCLALLAFVPLTRQQIDTWQNSETLWTNVIELYPNTEQAYSIRGNYYGKRASKAPNEQEQKAYMQKAFDDFQAAIKLNTERAEVFEGLGNIYGMRGEFEKALEQYSVILDKGQGKGSVYFNRAVTFSMLNRYQEAIADYTKAMELSPSKALQALTNRAIAYLQTGQWQAALSDYNQLFAQSQGTAEQYLNRGIAKENLGDRAGARGDYQQALQLKPQLHGAQQRLNALQ